MTLSFLETSGAGAQLYSAARSPSQPPRLPDADSSDGPRRSRGSQIVNPTLDLGLHAAVAKLGIRDGFRSHWAKARGGSNPSSRIVRRLPRIAAHPAPPRRPPELPRRLGASHGPPANRSPRRRRS